MVSSTEASGMEASSAGIASIGIIGAMGRMGRVIAAVIAASDTLKLVAVSEMPGHPALGQTYLETGLVIGAEASVVFAQANVVVDFTPPGNTQSHARMAADTGTAYIVGTTGLSEADHAALNEAAVTTAIVQAGNFSLGVNLLVALTKKTAEVLGDDWDIEILEMHHRNKVDAPSGTAVMLGEAAARGRGVSLDEAACRTRDGIVGERPKGEIGFATLRGGAVIGEHDVIFTSDDERVTFSHRAENRGLFAAGAVRAADWAHKQKPGRYTMLDVLALDL